MESFIDDKEWENNIFKILKTYYSDFDHSYIQKKCFDNFIHHRINKIIEEESFIEVPINDKQIYRVEFGQVFVDRPYVIDENRKIKYITPFEARMRELNYSGTVSVNIKTSIITTKEDGTEEETNIETHMKRIIAKIPIMLQSSKCNLYQKSRKEIIAEGECCYDYGGYFIIKGKERALVSQERMNHNIVYVFDQKVSNKYNLIAEIRSMSEETRHSVFIQMKMNTKRVFLQLPFIQQDIPLGVIFKAFDLTNVEIEKILKINIPLWKSNKVIKKFIDSILFDAEKINDVDEAITYISDFSLTTVMKERRKKYVQQILNNELFPHLSISSSKSSKTLFLGYMLNKLLLTYVGIRKIDDRDHLNNKRLELSGYLISELFRTLYKRFVRTIEQYLEKRQDIVVITNRSNIITLGMNHCFATGNWGVPKSNYIRTGVSQILTRLTYNSFLSHLKRILVPIGKEGKNTKVRQIHTSQIGFICPHETPEGSQSGIVKNMVPIIDITIQEDNIFVRQCLEDIPYIITNLDSWLRDVTYDDKNPTKIFLNGNWLGIVTDLDKTIKKLKYFKKIGILSQSVSYCYDTILDEINIFSDEGRLLRPLFSRNNFPTLSDLKTKSFKQLIDENKIFFLDSYQIENEVIAMTKKEMFSKDYYTFCEIHPSLMSSLCVSLIPYPEHTQSPRITYHASMGKQAIGLSTSNSDVRLDTLQHLLFYPEKPVIQSHHGLYNNCNELPFGNNLIVAVATYSGYNQEDSVILNKSSIERGLFRSLSIRTLIIEEKKKNTIASENICNVPEKYRSRTYDYSKLDENGIIKVGQYIGIGDVIVGKLQKINDKNNNDEWQDSSVITKSGEEGYIHKVFLTTSPEGYKIIKVQVKNLKIPEIGDKVASRSAQKGTISMILNQEDMPSTISGIVPDLIINPLCIPSRMTINQLIECLGAKSLSIKGENSFCTAFSNYSNNIIPELSKSLEKCGFNLHGNEMMYNGMTGENFSSSIFIGPTYYHRLKHLVSAKIHARNNGAIQALTRQPLEGRSREGGLRFGEMERDCMISHGVSRFLKERLFDVSDYFELFVCSKCGNIPHNNTICNMCSCDIIKKIPLPYACKLLFQQLNALGIKINMLPSL
tara:strand:- start:24 stop:3377 length:3354 start_codon:yes stop_codon:yes gene_type:complete